MESLSRRSRVATGITVLSFLAASVFGAGSAAADATCDEASSPDACRPAGLSATISLANPRGIRLTWQLVDDPPPDKLVIVRSPALAAAAEIPGTSQDWLDTSAEPGRLYDYRVCARFSVTETYCSNTVSQGLPAAGGDLPVPSITSVQLQADGILLSWRSSRSYGFFQVRWAQKGQPEGQYGVGGGSSGSYLARPTQLNRAYVLKVQGCNHDFWGTSHCSGWAVTETAIPVPPSGLTASVASTWVNPTTWIERYALTWQPGRGLEALTLELMGSAGEYVGARLPPDQTRYIVEGPFRKTSHDFRVCGFFKQVPIGCTEWVTVGNPKPPSPKAPVKIVVSAYLKSEVNILWAPGDNISDWFEVERQDIADVSVVRPGGEQALVWTPLAPRIAAGQRDFLKDPLQHAARTAINEPPTYRVCAGNSGGRTCSAPVVVARSSHEAPTSSVAPPPASGGLHVGPPGRSVVDAQLGKEVQESLQTQAPLLAPKIGVSVKAKVVTLDGTVPTLADKATAERLAKAVPGVTGLDSRLVVRP